MQNLSFRTRIGLALGFALFIFLVLPASLHPVTRVLATWAAGVTTYLVLAIVMMIDATAETTRDRAQNRQIHSAILFALITTTAMVSFIAFRLMRGTPKTTPMTVLTVHLVVSIIAIASTWLLLHTLFAKKYASLYYRRNPANLDEPARGLLFVHQETPTYWDFLYFSFVMGATAQTSDTLIASQPMRRLALGQAIVSFWFFVGIIGMTINIVSGLLQAE